MVDGASPVVLRADDPGVVAYYVYVDNLGGLCLQHQRIVKLMDEWEALFEERHLALHKSEVGSSVKSLGVQLDGDSKSSMVTGERFWLVRGAISAILRRRSVSGVAISVVVGHLTFILLAVRPAPSRRAGAPVAEPASPTG